jgi:membrane fusion protein, multidrug efflux system
MRASGVAGSAMVLSLMLGVSMGGPVGAAEVRVTTTEVDDLKAVVATVEPIHQLAARTRIGGTLIKLSAKEGDSVEAGTVVALVADQKIALQLAALDARISAATAQRDQARTDFQRASNLAKTGAGAVASADQARTNLDVAERTLVALAADREVVAQSANEGAVLSPASGRVLELKTTEGSVVMPGETVLTLAEGGYILRLQLPERHATSIRAGDTVRIAAREDGAKATTGVVRLVYPEIRGGRVIADVGVDELGDYFVGERTRVFVPTGKRRTTLIPTAAVSVRAGVQVVRLKSGAEAIVQPGERHGDAIEILAGLVDGDVVVVP